MAVDLTTMTPIKLGTTVLATESVNYETGAGGEMLRHSGLPYATSIVQSTVAPRLTFRTFFEDVYGVLGFAITKLTAVEWHQQTFTNFAADAGGVKYVLATSATAYAYITGLSEGAAGTIMADVEVVFLSADGTTHPVAEQSAVTTILALAAEPAKQVRGPIAVNGTALPGVTSFALSTGIRAIPAAPVDGETFSKTVVDDGGDFTFNIGSNGVKLALATITNNGSAIGASDVVVYLRDVDANGLTTGTTGVSFTVAEGRVSVSGVSQSVGATDTGTINIMAINAGADRTLPVAVSLAATLP